MRYQNEQKQTACFLNTQKIALQISSANNLVVIMPQVDKVTFLPIIF